MRSTRDQIVDVAGDLLESQGFHATGLNQIVKESGAPKGSLYYYFPAGKDEIAEAAIEQAGRAVAERIRAGLAASDDAAAAVRLFVNEVAHYVEASGFRSGGPLMTVAMETATSNQRLNRACRDAYTRLQGAFEARLTASGYAPPRARELAGFIAASIEGGIILSRVYHTGDPLRLVAEQLGQMLAANAL
ncbi:MAG: TetR/AcrR family transcriptional regulator [Roseiflexaceae bacterium]